MSDNIKLYLHNIQPNLVQFELNGCLGATYLLSELAACNCDLPPILEYQVIKARAMCLERKITLAGKIYLSKYIELLEAAIASQKR